MLWLLDKTFIEIKLRTNRRRKLLTAAFIFREVVSQWEQGKRMLKLFQLKFTR